MTEKQEAIFNKIAEMEDRLEDFKYELAFLHGACETLRRERDTAIQQAEKAEREVASMGPRSIERGNALQPENGTLVIKKGNQ